MPGYIQQKVRYHGDDIHTYYIQHDCCVKRHGNVAQLLLPLPCISKIKPVHERSERKHETIRLLYRCKHKYCTTAAVRTL